MRRRLALACGLAVLLCCGVSEARKSKGGDPCADFETPDGPGWKAWGSAVRKSVKAAWYERMPAEARAGKAGLVLVVLRLNADGSIRDAQVVKHDDGATRDMQLAPIAAMGAVTYPPLPPGNDEGIRITYLFNYNVTSAKKACRFRESWKEGSGNI